MVGGGIGCNNGAARPLLSVLVCRRVPQICCHTISSYRTSCISTTRGGFSSSLCCLGGGQFSGKHVSTARLSGRKLVAKKIWKEFFSDPSEWWDHRSEKANGRYPDFKHKKTQQPLWLDNKLTPPWVEGELAAMAPGTLRSHIFSWNERLRRHVKEGYHAKTIELFQQLQEEGMSPNKVTYFSVINACSGLQSLQKGRYVHDQIIERGYESDAYVANCLVDMYAKCGSLLDAWSVFNKMPGHDVVSWNTIIWAYVKFGQGLKALELFRTMQEEGVEPDSVTFVGLLNSCASEAALEEGRRVHEQIIRRGCESDISVATGLVDMYAKCGSITDAWTVFNTMREHNVVSWSAMIVGYVKCGQGMKAIELFMKMQQEGVEPNAVTFVGVLTACSCEAALEEGRQFHEQIIERRYEQDVCVATCLVDMYAKCGSTEEAWSMFNKMAEHDVVSWSAMIGGFVKSGQGLKAMELFQKMEQEGVEPNNVTFVGVLNACASVAALGEDRHVHEQIVRRGGESDVRVANCLLDMYFKCGSIEDAWSVFNKMQETDVVSWNTMIGGYVMHGYAKEAIELFKRMGKNGVQIDGISFICLLSSCRHGGLVKEGLRYSKYMTSLCNIVPTVEHYVCLVDLLGRAGRLEEAKDMIQRMPMEESASLWMSLLGACRVHSNVAMAEWAAKRCWELEPDNASGHVLLSNIYAAARIWEGRY